MPGVGNDLMPVRLYDAGWKDIFAFDYSKAGLERSRNLFGEGRLATVGTDGECTEEGVRIIHADARDLPLSEGSFDVILDKGTLDAIDIAGHESFIAAAKEFTRVTKPGGLLICISSVVMPDDLQNAFAEPYWEMIHGGGLAFAPDGEATIDLGSDLYSWRRTENLS